jgi:hypothetical protein
MKETAVKWLEEFLKQHDCAYSSLDYYEFKIPMHIFDKKFEEAKKMEMEHIFNAYVYGAAYGIDAVNGYSPNSYFKETFNTNKK